MYFGCQMDPDDANLFGYLVLYIILVTAWMSRRVFNGKKSIGMDNKVISHQKKRIPMHVQKEPNRGTFLFLTLKCADSSES